MIGEETQGKPFGYYPIDNCGKTYFTIQFQSENAKGFGEYSDGFSPKFNGSQDISASVETPVEGCIAVEDYQHALGDESEKLIDVSLSYLDSGVCTETNLEYTQKTIGLSEIGQSIKAPIHKTGLIMGNPSK